MYFLPFFKIKLLTVLSMVFMGLFSRFVLGFPILVQTSTYAFHGATQSHRFPDSGSRTSLRFISPARYVQKCRRLLKDGNFLEEEVTLIQTEYNHSHLDFVGEVIEDDIDSYLPRL